MSKPKVIIVDKFDNPIGLKERGEIDLFNIFRASGIIVRNTKGEIVIAQRKMTKRTNPGKWGPSVAGTVEEGETYESNAYKEAEEELGLRDIKLDIGPKYFINDLGGYFCQWFTCVVDKPAEDFVLQQDEVEQVRWISRGSLLRDMGKNSEKYVTGLFEIVQIL